MLARASSDAGVRLRRSKSTSSAHRPAPHGTEPLDPEVAQQQALAAATVAFSRQTAQHGADSRAKRNSEVTRTKSAASRKSISSQGSHFPPRGSSFRSQNPTSSAYHASSQLPVRTSTLSTDHKLPPFPSPVIDATPTRPLSAHLGDALANHPRPNIQPKSSRQTVASSITSQQIRKARSMYYASSIQTGSPIARPPAKYLAAPTATSASPKLTVAPASPQTRQAGPPSLPSHRIPVTIAPHETVEEARDVYLQAFQQRSIKHKPSLFLAPFRKRQSNTKERSTRVAHTPTTMSYDCNQMAVGSSADATLVDFVPQAEKPDKRSFSGSLKSKIRRVFKRNVSRVPTLPVQQIEASRDYFEHSRIISACADERGFEVPSPDDAILQRARSRASTVEEAHLGSARVGSPDSGSESIQNLQYSTVVSQTSASASRVTSWDTTSTGDTLTQRALKRLTVIHEAKDSIGSEVDHLVSLSADRATLLPATFTAFREPMPIESSVDASTPPINPKRIFSALMREIDAAKSVRSQASVVASTLAGDDGLFGSSERKGILDSRPSKDPSLVVSSETHPLSSRPASTAGNRVPGKKSSIRSFGRAIRSTIRNVTPGEHCSSPCPDPSMMDLHSTGDIENNNHSPLSNVTPGSQETENEPRTAIFRGGDSESGAVIRR
jgi:hypothetical protein